MQTLSNYILEKLDALVVVVNFKGAIAYANPAVQNLLGQEVHQLVGTHWMGQASQSREEAYEMKRNTLQLLKGRKSKERDHSFPAENKLRGRGGREVWVLWNLSLGPDQTLVGIGQDITARKQAETKLKESHALLKLRNKDMLDSIHYSQRIQAALLPPLSRFKKPFQDAFVFFKPKDIVSGDFYCCFEENGLHFVAAIDCTGHGVPGALMTMIANTLLKNIVRQGLNDPAEILHQLDKDLFAELNQRSNEATRDGMDIALCVFDLAQRKLEFTGAFRPMIRINAQGICDEVKAARYPIGFYNHVPKIFETIRIDLDYGDRFYLFTDGYIDQFGGPRGKKFNKRAFRELLLEIQGLTMEEQEGYLEYAFNNWKQQHEQIDDVLVIGIEV